MSEYSHELYREELRYDNREESKLDDEKYVELIHFLHESRILCNEIIEEKDERNMLLDSLSTGYTI